MLELKGINKTYISKKSSSTKALIDINLKFNNKGLVFIVGSSGSGKSTLLNVIGSLDKYDSGDLIIDGKSTKKFKNKDFDYYRNNYIGFIFQDFNIIDDYNIIDNINLPLKLQNKKRDSTDLLKKLGIEDLCKRKPNELSGGEKQRVAIARALIKDPKIILADEPTGNLDSKNSKSIMDLLKEISKDRLVIVVSHDLELAKTYNDRIIEISDAFVIKDSDNKNIINDDKYISKKSKLPFKDIFKLGFKSLNNKKSKLIFSIILMTFSTIFLSIMFSIKTYAPLKNHSKLLKDNNINTLEIKRYYHNEFDNLFFKTLNKNKLNEIESKFNLKGSPMYSLRGEEDIVKLLKINSDEVILAEIIESDFDKKIIGNFPSNLNEILITKPIADLIIKKGIYDINNDIYSPKSYEELINSNKIFKFGEYNTCKISGIGEYNSNYIYVKNGFISNLKENSNSELIASNQYILTIDKNSSVNKVLPINKNIEYYNGTEWVTTNSIKEDEVILSISVVIREYVNYLLELEEYKLEHPTTTDKEFMLKYINPNKYIGKYATFNIYEDRDIYFSGSFIADKSFNLKVIGLTGFDNDAYSYVNYNSIKDYLATYKQIDGVLVNTNNSYTIMKKLENDSEYIITTKYNDSIAKYVEQLNNLSESITILFIIFLIFSILLIMNFMYNNIIERKKTIGILKALGTKNSDIIKIFIIESLLVSFITVIINFICLIFVFKYINNYYNIMLNINLNPFIINSKLIASILIYVVLISLISSIIPIIRINKMKPIDAIKEN